MKRIYVSFLCMAICSLFLASCGSKPKDKPDTKVDDAAQKVEQKIDQDNSREISALEAAENARKAAIEAGADKSAKVQFAAADAVYQQLKLQSESGADVSTGLKDSENRFRALEAYAEAKKAKQRIDENGYADYDKSSYDRGCAALEDLDNLFGSDTNLTGEAMRAKADEANGAFKNVIFAAFKKFAKDERMEAFKAKRDADGVMAAVAAKTEYGEAVNAFRSGDANYAQQNPEAAYNYYKNAKSVFASIFVSVSEKRAAAQKAMRDAQKKVEESNNYAARADREVPLTGDNVEGIESADAKLLEDDSYADPAAQAASIPEDISDQEAAK